MLESDYFAKKRLELGLDRGDRLAEIQAVLETWYPGEVRAKRLHRGILTLITQNASVAGDLRMRQIELIDQFDEVTRLQITIG